MVSRSSFGLAVALALVVVTSGCVSGPLSDQQEEQLAERVESELADIDGYEATVTTELEMGEQTQTSRTHVKADLDDGKTWQRTLAPEERAGDLSVSNGSVTWQYDASEHTASKYDSGGAAGGLANLTSGFGELAENYNVTVTGSETIDSTETHVVELTPENDAQAGTMTVWLDQSSYFPVKIHQQFELENQTYETTVRYENVTLDPDFDAGTFDYEPPADADVETVDLPDTEQFGSESDLRDAAEQPVASPELPDDFEFERGTVVVNDGNESVTATYTNGSTDVLVGQYPGSQYSADGEPVRIDGRDATLATYGDTALVTWTCEDVRYSVTTTAGERLAKSVATSIDCE